MWCLAAKNNIYHNPISEDVLRKCKDSAKGAWIVCDYDQFTRDATTHTDEEQIIGVVPRDSTVELRRDKMGVLWIVVTAVLSKVYHPEVWEMFKQHNFRYVSCEFRCTEDDEDEEGNKPITSFDIVGITILGSGTLPACEDANMKIMKFSADEANKYHAKHEKDKEYNKCLNGIIGLETMIPLVYTHFIKTKLATLEDFVNWFVTNPNKVFNLPERKIKKGYVADIAILDIKTTRKYSEEEILSLSKNSPYIGMEMTGFAKYTIVNGKVIWRAR